MGFQFGSIGKAEVHHKLYYCLAQICYKMTSDTPLSFPIRTIIEQPRVFDGWIDAFQVYDLKVAHSPIGAIKMNQKQSYLKETPQRTPLKARPYLRTLIAQNTPFSRSPQKIDEAEEIANQSPQHDEIYGTNINIKSTMKALQHFIINFETPVVVDELMTSQRIYRNRIIEMEDSQQTIFQVDGRHLYEADRNIYMQFVYYPAEMISCFDHVLKNIYENYFIEAETNEVSRSKKIAKKSQLMLGLKHLHDSDRVLVKDLNSTNIGRLVCLHGIVIRTSQIYPQMKCAYFKCQECGGSMEVELENARVTEPRSCTRCWAKDCMELQHNLCTFTDKQYIKFQELPEYVCQGQTPSSITLLAYDNNVDGFRPGDRVEMIGIYRAAAKLVQRGRKQVYTVFNTYIDMISFNLLEEKHHKISSFNIAFSDQEKQRFAKLAQSENIWTDLAKSFAPSIFEQTIIKKGLLAQLFGGTRKRFQETGRNRFRSDINICLLGDPSTAKSQLLQQVHKISSRSIYTSGRGSSAVGLTANVRKDPQTREFVLQSGALVLSDQGICCIDEFDKMNENSRTILLQAMQQQTISIAKAGIVCQLNSRTAILAAANPVNSKYDNTKSVIENINLPPALLTRFDLIYLMLDIPNEIQDRQLAAHILNMYATHKVVEPKRQEAIGLKDLSRYITYAREYIHPTITEKAGEVMKKQYLSMRANGQSTKTISATPRQLESLIRLSQAFAKMRLSREVTELDVLQAINLLKEATLRSAIDPATGIVNMQLITIGKSAYLRKREQEVAQKLRDVLIANETLFKKPTTIDKLMQRLTVTSRQKEVYTKEELLNGLRLLQTEDLIVLFGEDKQKPLFKIHRQTLY